MMSLIDKLCDHLPNDKIKMLIDNGFDEWETVCLLSGDELVKMGYTSEECIIIMVAVNGTAREFKAEDVYSEETMKKVL